jgi:DNA-binding MarR family transcriptional regulator
MEVLMMSRPQQVDELAREMRLMSSFDTLFSQAVAERVGMHSTDIETMDLLNVLGAMTAGELSGHTGLTSGATTRLIDRMERAGYVRRRHDPADRRRVIIEPVWENLEELGHLYEPLAARLSELWATFEPAQLDAVLDFIRKTNRVVSEENARLRAETDNALH